MASVVAYNTEKALIIKNWQLRLVKLFMQILVAMYLAWSIFYQDGYQTSSMGIGLTQVKLKGNAYEIINKTIRVWDGTDVVYPPKELDALFVTTNYQLTKHQQPGICQGNQQEEECPCQQYKATLNGIETGDCGADEKYCNLWAWCPPENNISPNASTVLNGVRNFTIYLKNFVRWEEYGISRNNVNGKKTPGYNFFTIDDLVKGTGYSFEDIAVKGAAVGVIVKWDCDFDRAADRCQPSFDYRRLDNPNSLLSSGFNFRHTDVYRTDIAQEQRDLIKVYGVRLVFLTAAVGRKFNLVRLLQNIGGGLGVLFFATYFSDLICMWLLPSSSFYRNKKYMNVDEQQKESKRQEWLSVLSPEKLNKAYF